MVRRSTIIFAASFAVLSTIGQVSGFAAAVPPHNAEDGEKPRYLKRHTKRFVLSYPNVTATTSRGPQGPVGGGQSTSELETLAETLTTSSEPVITSPEVTTTPQTTQTPDLGSIESQSSQSSLQAAIQASLSQAQQQLTQTPSIKSTSLTVSSFVNTLNEENTAKSTSATATSEGSVSIAQSTSAATLSAIVPSITPPSITIPSVTQSNIQSLLASTSNQLSASAESGAVQATSEALSSTNSQIALPISTISTQSASIKSDIGQPSSAISSPSNTQTSLPSIPAQLPTSITNSEQDSTGALQQASSNSGLSSISTPILRPIESMGSSLGSSLSSGIPVTANTMQTSQQLSDTATEELQPSSVTSPSSGITARTATPESQTSTSKPVSSPPIANQQTSQNEGEPVNTNTVSQQLQSATSAVRSTQPTSIQGNPTTTGEAIPTIGGNTQQPLTQFGPTSTNGQLPSIATANPGSAGDTNSKQSTLNTENTILPIGQNPRSSSSLGVDHTSSAQAPSVLPATHTDNGASANPLTSQNGVLHSVGGSPSLSASFPLPTSELIKGSLPLSSPLVSESVVVLPTATNSKLTENPGLGGPVVPTATPPQDTFKASIPIPTSQPHEPISVVSERPGSAAPQTSSIAGGIVPASQTNIVNTVNTAISDSLTHVPTDSNKGITTDVQSPGVPISPVSSNGIVVPVTSAGAGGVSAVSHAGQQSGPSPTGTLLPGPHSRELPSTLSGSAIQGGNSPAHSASATQSVILPISSEFSNLPHSPTIVAPLPFTLSDGSVVTGVPATAPSSPGNAVSSLQTQQSDGPIVAPSPTITRSGDSVAPGSSVSPAPESLPQGKSSGLSAITSNEALGSSNTVVPPVITASITSPGRSEVPNSGATIVPSLSEGLKSGQVVPSSGVPFSQATNVPASAVTGPPTSGGKIPPASQSIEISGESGPQLLSTSSNGVAVPIQSSQPMNTGAVVTEPSASGFASASAVTGLPISGGSSPITVGSASNTEGVVPITAGQVTGSSSIPGGSVVPLIASIPTAVSASGQPVLSGVEQSSNSASGAIVLPLPSQQASASGGNGQATGGTGQTLTEQSAGATQALSGGASGPTVSGQGSGVSFVSSAGPISQTNGASGQTASGQITGAAQASSVSGQATGTSGQSAISETSGAVKSGSNTQATAATGQSAAGQTASASESSGPIATGASQSGSESQAAPAPATGTVTGPPAESQTPQSTDLGNVQHFPSNAKGPFTQQPTGYDSATVQSVPTSILSTSSLPPSQTGNTEPTGLPTGVPLVLYPPEGPVKRPDNTQLIQVGFLYPLNYNFVWQNPQSQQQIFKYVPMGIAWGLQIDVENVTMQTLRAWDTTQDLHYITTLALAWVPTGQVDALGLLVHTPTSRFYHTPDNSTNTLLSMINIALPINADNSTDGGDPTTFGAVPSSSSNTKEGGAPVGGGIGSSNPVRASSVGIGCGVAFGAAVYGAAMFLVARRYKKRRQSHLRSPSMFSSPVMSHVGPDAGAGAALMSGGMGDHRSPSPYHDEDGRAGSRGSGRSGSTGRQQISAPVMAENSLGWN